MKAIFLDRDGVLVKHRNDHIKDISEVVFEDNIIEPLQQLIEKGYYLFIVSNQSAVGRGIISEEKCIDIHKYIVDYLHDKKVYITSSYLCMHSPEDKCICRKPKPFLVDKACSEYKIKRKKSYFIGDYHTDLACAHFSQIMPVLVRTGRGTSEKNIWSNFTFNNLEEFNSYIKCT